MAKIILTGHGKQGSALKEAVEMIMGPIGDQIDYADFSEDDSLDSLKSRIEEKLSDDMTYIFCDIKGGTPFNCAFLLQKKYKIKIVCGMNLAMVLDTCLNITDEQLENRALKSGVEAIVAI